MLPSVGSSGVGLPGAGAVRADALSRGAGLPEPPPTRTIVLWCPDWPVIAAARAAGTPPEQPFALIAKGLVFASSASARQVGVVRGLRVREAQARCTDLVTQPYDDALDHRAFEPVIRAIEAAAPGVEVLRPGTIALRARGPARYHGGERAAATILAGIAADHGAPGVRAGVADTPFAAEQAARARPTRPGERVRMVPVGGSGTFLAPLPLGVLGDPDLAMVLGRLGLTTLGDFAALTDEQVRDRFGVPGAFLHRLAGGSRPAGGLRAGRPTRPRGPGVLRAAARPCRPDRLRLPSFRRRVRRQAPGGWAGGDDHPRGHRRRTGRPARTGLGAPAVVRRRGRGGPGALAARRWGRPDRARGSRDHGRARTGRGGRPGEPRARALGLRTGRAGPPRAGPGAGHGRARRGRHAPDRWRSHPGRAHRARAVGRHADRWRACPRGRAGPSVAGEAPRAPAGDGPRTTPAGGRRRGGRRIRGRRRPWRPDRGTRGGSAPTATAGGRFTAVTAWAGPWPLVVRWWESGGRRLHRLQLVDADGRAWYLVLADHRWWAEAIAT
ncbi:DNA polymerase Y family protein [Curtobacterium sp. MCPF17_052]|uniref:Y-family DNA polymerase n=1 Tax=Curtobacterium sp. MCPF17_052 TaxID=2175655 RepID=UPI0024DFE5B1|nr:DNA polymerase Y family protein [Curtobacterium sp. MCPF17_052]WIB12185.1 DNA polymerase Y family protein [Curtobacterium sp. MCPF17_052]